MNSQEMNMTADDLAVDLSYYKRSGEWDLISTPVESNLIPYNCCAIPYSQVKITLELRRKALYYIINLVLPCCVFSVLSITSFILPPASGERVGIDITILLALSVFQTIVNGTLPPTSDAVPLLGIYFMFVMVICAVSLVITTFVLRVHHNQPNGYPMPQWAHKLLCGRLAVALRVKTPTTAAQPTSDVIYPRLSDAGDNHDPTMGSGHVTPLDNNDVNVMETSDQSSMKDSGIVRADVLYNIRDMLETRLSTDERRRRDKDASQQAINDWITAAAVVDRVCFIVFSVCFVVGTLVLFLTANFIKQ